MSAALQIRHAAIIGAGTMGAQIAAHLANAGIPSLLLDVTPTELTAEEQTKGLSLQSPEVRNRIVRVGFERMKALKPAPLFVPENANLITLGNMMDDMDRLREADWIIEAVVERIEVKQEVFAEIEKRRKSDSIVSTNTSGLSIAEMSEGRSDDFRSHFLGTHFFNPPRYMHLLEIIPEPDTAQNVLDTIADFGERVLGKGIVRAKDTPGFIANRLGAFALAHQMLTGYQERFTVDEVDAITSAPLLRPRSGTFRLADLIGLDLIIHILNHLHDSLPKAAYRETFRVPEFLRQIVQRGWLGEKSNSGFYQRVRSAEGSQIQRLDLFTYQYMPAQRPQLPSVEHVKKIKDPRERIRTFIKADDRAANFGWKVLSETLVYCAEHAREVADDLISIDNAMKWGWNWELGPFEIWDALGAGYVVDRLQREGRHVPDLAQRALMAGGSFFASEDHSRFMLHFDGTRRPIERDPTFIDLHALKQSGKTVRSNDEASLIDLGDGVICLEFHSKLNTIGLGTLEMLRVAVDDVKRGFEALVIGNQGEMFSAGANLNLFLDLAQQKKWNELDALMRNFQDTMMALKCCRKPAVIAPFAHTLGGACEMTLHSYRVQAYAELSIGLVEVGVGLIPGAGGLKEMAIRSQEEVGSDPEERGQSFSRVLQNIALGKTSASAAEARRMRFLRAHDRISLNPRRLLYDAKQHTLELRKGFQQHSPRRDISALGKPGIEKAEEELQHLQRDGTLTEYDVHIARRAASVMCGGDVAAGTRVSEQDLLDLERQHFISLLGESKTHERIQHMLKTGKRLRN